MKDKTIDGKPLHKLISGWTNSLKKGDIDRREFLALSTAFGATAATAYGLAGMAIPVAANAATPKKGGTLRMSMSVLDLADPRSYDWSEKGNLGRCICDHLVRFNSDGTFSPWLLKSWSVSDDAKTYVLKLRPGVKWNNGDDCTAEDIAFNITRWCDATAAGNSMSGRMVALSDENTKKAADGAIEVVDSLTVRLNLNKADISLIASMSDYPAMIVHRSFTGNLAKQPIGTAAFELDFLEVGVKARFVKRTDGQWWGGEALLDAVEFVDFGTDPAAEISAFEAEEIDLNYQTHADYIEILDSIGLRRSDVATGATLACRMNVNNAPYSNQRVRQALQMAVDNQKLLDIGYGGLGAVAENHHVGPMHPEYFKLPAKTRNIEKAKAILKEEGLEDYEFEFITSDQDWNRNVGDAMAAQMREAGITLKRTIIPSSSFWNEWDKYPFSATEWNGRPLGVQVLSLAYRSGESWNESGYSNPEFDKKVNEALTVADAKKRRVLMEDIELILQDSGILIQPFWRSLFAHMTTNVKNYDKHPMHETHLEKVWLS